MSRRFARVRHSLAFTPEKSVNRSQYHPLAVVCLAIATTLVACEPDRVVAPDSTSQDKSSLANQIQDSVPGQWIIVFKKSTMDHEGLSDRLLAAHGGRRSHLYSHVFKGFAADLPAGAIERIRANPTVEFVERDAVGGVISDSAFTVSLPIDRIDHPYLPLDGYYSWDGTGSGVRVYLVDTGINVSHPGFGGRATNLSWNSQYNGTDCNGHGTQMAGEIGGALYGVARSVQVSGVRVFDNCSGSTSTSAVIAGLNWIIANRQLPAIVNVSLRFSYSSALNLAADAVKNNGMLLVAGSGNDNANCSSYSPGSAYSVLTVAGSIVSQTQDTWWSGSPGSNYGGCVDIIAPGATTHYMMTMAGGYSAVNGGTSASSALTSGVAAIWLGLYTQMSPEDLTQALIRNSTPNTVLNVPSGTWNRLLYSRVQLAAYILGPAVVFETSPVNYQAKAFGGSTPYTYAWYKDNVLVSTSSTYSMTSGFPGNGWVMRLEVTSASGVMKQDTMITYVVCPNGEYNC